MISKVALYAGGLEAGSDLTRHPIHSWSQAVSAYLAGLHIALNWRGIRAAADSVPLQETGQMIVVVLAAGMVAGSALSNRAAAARAGTTAHRIGSQSLMLQPKDSVRSSV
jgi:hypothetical protein